MEEKKMPTLLIIVLSVLGICLVGFGIWYGVNYSRDLGEPEGPTPEPSTEEPTEPGFVGEKIDFPQKSDDNVVIGRLTDFLTESTVKTNFKNLEFTKNENKIIFNCEHYVDQTTSCGEVKISINNEFNLTIDTGYEYSLKGVYDTKDGAYDILGYNKLFKVNNYYVVYNDIGGGLDINTITIYDKSNKVYTNNLVKSAYGLNVKDYYTSATNVPPVIVNNVLHFIQQKEDYSIDKVKYNTIDLNKDKIEVNLVKEFTGYISGEK